MGMGCFGSQQLTGLGGNHVDHVENPCNTRDAVLKRENIQDHVASDD
jgi:hypothetical protein